MPALKRPNLQVVTNALVHRILLDGTRAVGVEYARGGRLERVDAAREVILAAGAIGSPHVLQLSGVGDPDHLGRVGIAVQHALPGVGKNLQDHYLARVTCTVTGAKTLNEKSRGLPFAGEVLRYLFAGTGMLTYAASLVAASVKVLQESATPDIQCLLASGSFAPGPIRRLDDKPGMTAGIWQMRPLSRGYVEARSNRPADPPAINPRYLSEETDRRAVIGGLRMARRLFAAPVLKKYVVAENLPGSDVQSDDELLDYARQYGSTVFHATCTCKMGPDAMAVVDDRLRVHGLQGPARHRRLGDADRHFDQHQRADDHDRRKGRRDDPGGGAADGWRHRNRRKQDAQIHHRAAFPAAGVDCRGKGVFHRRRPRLRVSREDPLDRRAAPRHGRPAGRRLPIDIAKSLGIHTELPAVPSLALGSAEVTLPDMTAAMDAIAVDSRSIEPYTIRKIRTGTRALLYTRPDTVVERPDWNRDALVQLLEGVVTNGTGRAARLDRRAAGKTGTTQDYRDAWFIGFTSDIVVGVWVGNDDDSPMDGVVGGDLPAKIWHDYVEEAERIMSTPIAAAPHHAAPQLTPPAAPAQPPGVLRGVPKVADTATLVFPDGIAHLQGVAGEKGELAHELEQYIRGREVVCQATEPGTAQYRCGLGDIDVGEAVVLNGAGRVAANASGRLLAAEQKAQAAGRGIWRE